MIDLVVALLRVLLIQVAGYTGIGLPIIAAVLLIRLFLGQGRSARR
jgi:hypothetical protein